jgi:hypothetical protein
MPVSCKLFRILQNHCMPSHQFYHKCTVPLQSWRSIVSLEIKDNHPNLWMAKILSNLSRITSCILAWLAINVPLRVLKIYCYFWEHIKITNGHLAGWLDHTFLTSLLKYYLWSHKTYQQWSIKYSNSDEKLLLFEVNQNLRLNIFNMTTKFLRWYYIMGLCRCLHCHWLCHGLSVDTMVSMQ